MIEMRVAHLGIDPANHTPVVVLQEVDGERTLPILIGTPEATAIAMELQGHKPQRPLTHDLLKHVLRSLGGELARVVVTEIRDNTYFAELIIRRAEHVFQVDARPSDSIALALRVQAPIFVRELVLNHETPASPETDIDPGETLRKYLEGLDPQDFGRFQR